MSDYGGQFFGRSNRFLGRAWSDIVRFIRQLSHDLRNHLNAIELQSAYIGELERDEELTERDQAFA